MKSGKRYMTEGMELPNQEKIRMFEEKEIYKYLGISEVETIKQAEMKEKVFKKLSPDNGKLPETKLRSNLLKGINSSDVALVRYSGQSLKRIRENLNKWTREQEN